MTRLAAPAATAQRRDMSAQGCGERQTTRRCQDCNLFTRRLGSGGAFTASFDAVLASRP